MNQYPNTLFETAEQRASRELYEAQRKAVFDSIPVRAESDDLARRIAALEAELAANTLPCGHHHSLMLKSAETGDPLYCELCDLRAQRNDLEIELAAIQRVAEQYQDEAGKLTHELAQARAECERLRADAERYRWLRDNALGMDSVADPDNMVQVWHGTDPALQSYGKTLDAAIDAALARWEA